VGAFDEHRLGKEPSVVTNEKLIIIIENTSFIWLYLSSSFICHGVELLVEPFRSHVSRSLFRDLPWFLLPIGGIVFHYPG